MTEGEARSVVAGVTELGGKFITSLPAQFLVLVLMNAVFILGLLFFLDRENTTHQQTEQHLAEARERVLLPLLQGCLQHKGD
jgi:hypothetical protein